VHPYVLDAERGALSHGGLRSLRLGPDHDRANPAWDRLQVVIALVTFDLIRIRVHREYLVSALAKALVHHVAAMALGVPRDPRDRDPLVDQELRGRLVDWFRLVNRRHVLDLQWFH